MSYLKLQKIFQNYHPEEKSNAKRGNDEMSYSVHVFLCETTYVSREIGISFAYFSMVNCLKFFSFALVIL